jgi:hypothetical protein
MIDSVPDRPGCGLVPPNYRIAYNSERGNRDSSLGRLSHAPRPITIFLWATPNQNPLRSKNSLWR